MKPIGVYIHVPYCRVACPYCDFVKRPVSGDAPDRFTDALCREIRDYDGPAEARSVFFGGGTPSLLSPAALERIFEALHTRFTFVAPDGRSEIGANTSAEISLEANPDDVTPETLRVWRDLGVNRLSLGVQSFDDDALQFLGRCHDTAIARRACGLVAEHFDNWGMDLIFGAKPISSWDATLAECRRFAPPHVSTYGLTYEERTPFWNRRHDAVDDDVSLDLYRRAQDVLHDYVHYEVSNFAKPGYESAHNMIYWRNEDYAGFGPGAVSYLSGVRSRNLPRIAEYLDRPGAKKESLPLTPREEKVETLIQHFRTRRGLSRAAYEARFHTAVESDFGDAIDALIRRGLLARENGAYRPTRQGYELNNEIGLALV